MRVCITGGGGYLGSMVTRTLLRAGMSVTVLERFDHGTKPLADAVRGIGVVRIVRGDVADPRVTAEAVKDCAAIIHLAGIVGYPACDADPAEAERTNVEGTRVVCQHAAGRLLLFASTGSTYGTLTTGLATEDLPVSPLTRYGRTKAAGEALVAAAGGMSLRLATLFGVSTRMRWDLLPHDFTRRAVRDRVIPLYEGHARRTFLHVEDAALAFVAALSGNLPPGEVFNVGRSWLNYTKREVADMAVAAVQSAMPLLTPCVVDIPGADPDQRNYDVGFAKISYYLPSWAEARGVTLPDVLPHLVGAAVTEGATV
jgi:nucleoside-diphosphate-sugar epimerase